MPSLSGFNIWLDLGEEKLNNLYQEFLQSARARVQIVDLNLSPTDSRLNSVDYENNLCVKLWQGDKTCEIIKRIKQDFPELKIVVVDFLNNDQLMSEIKACRVDGFVALLGLSPAKFIERLQTIANNS